MFIAPWWALLSHTLYPGESLLKFIGTRLSTAREKSDKTNPWLSVYTLTGGSQPEVSSNPPKAERSPRGWCLEHCVPTLHPPMYQSHQGCHLSQRACGMKPEVATLLSHIQLSMWHKNFQLWSWSSFLYLWHHQAYWAQNYMPGSGPKGHQVKKHSYSPCFSSLSTSQKMTGQKPMTHRPHSQPEVKSLPILYWHLNGFDLFFFPPIMLLHLQIYSNASQKLMES